MRCVAAIDGNPEMTRCSADILVANFAGRALSAPDPRKDRYFRAGFYIGIRPCALDFTGDFVTKGEWKRPPGADIELPVAAERKITVLHMQIGMTNTASLDPHQNFGSLRARRIDNGLA